ncbi:hypothetical protein [Actinoplanes sp. GCM10030250]|uniref:TY-Chap2 family putative peptide chaperone n=1 Tax=Actinoplanes sp. GCM10030250 TaxID=3273376 RepID=UPI00360819E5
MTMPPMRFVIMQSWWLATRLVRRHPDLTVIETHPGGGQYDRLSLVRGQENLININRAGSIRLRVRRRPGAVPANPLQRSRTPPYADGHRRAGPDPAVRPAILRLRPPLWGPPSGH